jgi:hypothetical protein
MRKAFMVAVVLCLVLASAGMIVSAKSENAALPAQHLYLYEMDTSTWEIVEDGAWGKLTWNPDGTDEADKFVFNGHGLEAGTEYCLIVKSNAPQVLGPHKIGEGTANGGGNVNIAGEYEFDQIPGNTIDEKIQLVLCSDLPRPPPGYWRMAGESTL